jgi:thiamine biosynthesis lipoprotein
MAAGRKQHESDLSSTTVPTHQSLKISMDTLVSIEVSSREPAQAVGAVMERASAWFQHVEQACSRFDERSEVHQLLTRVGEPMTVSPMLFELVQVALELARLSQGAFDPTIGALLEARGFNRNYQTGQTVNSKIPGKRHASFRDVRLDPARRTITLRQPVLLDLGAVAKGLAIDLAARELSTFDSFCIEAGGDIFARGQNGHGRPWRVGVQDPRKPEAVACVLEASDQAICTSGDYERTTGDGQGHHLIDPRDRRSVRSLTSVTVVAPTALAADGLATAAFILGPGRGLRLLENQGVDGLLILPSGETRATSGLRTAPLPERGSP